MFSTTKIALAIALVLGVGSAALAANEHDESVSEAQAAREAHANSLPWWWNAPAQDRGSFTQAGSAYGYVALPTPSRKKSQNH
jgi:hypothetical protein